MLFIVDVSGHEGRHLNGALGSSCGVAAERFALPRAKPAALRGAAPLRRAWPPPARARRHRALHARRCAPPRPGGGRRSVRAGRFRRPSPSSRRMRRAPAAHCALLARGFGVSLRNYRSAALVHPWMLAFAHRRLFEANLAKFDLFEGTSRTTSSSRGRTSPRARDDAALARRAATGALEPRLLPAAPRRRGPHEPRRHLCLRVQFHRGRAHPAAGPAARAQLRQAAQPVQRSVADAAGRLAALINSSQWRPRRPGASKHVLPGAGPSGVGRRRRPVSPRRGLPRRGLGTAVVPYEMTAGPRLAADARAPRPPAVRLQARRPAEGRLRGAVPLHGAAATPPDGRRAAGRRRRRAVHADAAI